jgi:hypothetical protein
MTDCFAIFVHDDDGVDDFKEETGGSITLALF